ncbi:MAG TPA: class I tRNA ligase family protein, partial [Phycisphaerae bacterium]
TWFSSALWPISTMGWPVGAGYASVWSRPMWDGENYTVAAVRAYFQKHVFLPALNNDEQKAAAAMQSFDCAYSGKQLDITFRDPAIENAVKDIITTMGYIHKPNDTIENRKSKIENPNAPEPGLLDYFYPTSLLSTAREILTLWVARMVIFGLYCKGDVPFKDVYIHAIIQDGNGQPMKKTLGNGVDPVDIVQSHGADALRFTLASMATETQDIRLPVQLVCPHCQERLPNNINGHVVIGCPKCKKQMTRPVQTAVATADAPMSHSTSDRFDIGRNFANKIWNATRFILSNITDSAASLETGNLKLETLEDRWILSRLSATISAAESAINGYHFAELAEALRSFFWTDLCDWYLEISKSRIKSGDQTVQQILLHCLQISLKLLHPLMPFITEEIWGKIPNAAIENQKSGGGEIENLLVTAPWPHADPAPLNPAAESQMSLIQTITTAIRELQNRYPAAKGKPVILQPRDAATQQLIEQSKTIIESLVGASLSENSIAAAKPADAGTAVLPEAQIFIPGIIDKATETAKLTKRQAELEKLVQSNTAKLANESFTSKAPPKIIQGLRDQLQKYQEELTAIQKNLAELA